VELTRRVKEYLDRAYIFKVNFNEAITKGDIEKASELLWGIFSCYMNALRVLRTGKPARRHGEIIEVGLDLAKVMGDEKLEKAVKLAEKCHSNFYHSFLDLEDIKECYEVIMYAVRKADEFIRKLMPEFHE